MNLVKEKEMIESITLDCQRFQQLCQKIWIELLNIPEYLCYFTVCLCTICGCLVIQQDVKVLHQHFPFCPLMRDFPQKLRVNKSTNQQQTTGTLSVIWQLWPSPCLYLKQMLRSLHRMSSKPTLNYMLPFTNITGSLFTYGNWPLFVAISCLVNWTLSPPGKLILCMIRLQPQQNNSSLCPILSVNQITAFTGRAGIKITLTAHFQLSADL